MPAHLMFFTETHVERPCGKEALLTFVYSCAACREKR